MNGLKVVKTGKGVCIAIYGNPSHNYGVSLAVWDHTVLPATRGMRITRSMLINTQISENKVPELNVTIMKSQAVQLSCGELQLILSPRDIIKRVLLLTVQSFVRSGQAKRCGLARRTRSHQNTWHQFRCQRGAASVSTVQPVVPRSDLSSSCL